MRQHVFVSYRHESPEHARAVRRLGELLRQALWDDQGNNARIRLAFLQDLAPDKVPVRLRAWHQFRPFDSDAQLNQLVRWIADCLGLNDIQLPAVRAQGLRSLFNNGLEDQENETLLKTDDTARAVRLAWKGISAKFLREPTGPELRQPSTKSAPKPSRRSRAARP